MDKRSGGNPVACHHVIGKWQERVLSARTNSRGEHTDVRSRSDLGALNSTYPPLEFPDANEPHPTLSVKQLEEGKQMNGRNPWGGTFEQILGGKLESQQLAVEKLLAQQLVQFRDCLTLELRQHETQLMQELRTFIAQHFEEFTATLDCYCRDSQTPMSKRGASKEPSGIGASGIVVSEEQGQQAEEQRPSQVESPRSRKQTSISSEALEGEQRDSMVSYSPMGMAAVQTVNSKPLGISAERDRLKDHIKRMAETDERGSTTKFVYSMTAGAWRCAGKMKLNIQRAPHRPLVKIIDSSLFTYITMAVILSNAVWIGYSTDQSLKEIMDGREVPKYHKAVNRGYFAFFALELAIRILALRSSWLLRKDWAWNVYDAVVVFASVLEEVASTLNLQFLRVLRVVRVVRLVRFIRVMRFFVGLRFFMLSVVNCAWVLIWSCVFMIFIIYIFAIVFCQGILQESDNAHISDLKNNFGSVLGAMYTLLLAISFGIPWGELADSLALITPAFRVLLSFFMIFNLFGVLNVVTGVFVERTASMKDHDRDLAIHHQMAVAISFVEELKGLLGVHGIEDENEMDWDTFVEFMAQTDVEMYLQTHGIDVSEASNLFKLLDVDDTGTISIVEFVYGCQHIKGLAKEMDIVLLSEQMNHLNDKFVEYHTHQNSNHRHAVAFMKNVMRELAEARMDIVCFKDNLLASVPSGPSTKWTDTLGCGLPGNQSGSSTKRLPFVNM